MIKKTYFDGKLIVLVSFCKNETPSERPVECFMRIGLETEGEGMKVSPQLRSRKMLIDPYWGRDVGDMKCEELLKRVVPDAGQYRWKTYCFSIDSKEELEHETTLLCVKELIEDIKERIDLNIEIDELENTVKKLLP